jgi:ribosomal protein L29
MKAKELIKLNESERNKKLDELKLELMKSKAVKSGDSKSRNIKKIIARILTLNKSENEELKNK